MKKKVVNENIFDEIEDEYLEDFDYDFYMNFDEIEDYNFDMLNLYVMSYGAIKKDYLIKIIKQSNLLIDEEMLEMYLEEFVSKDDIICYDNKCMSKYYKLASIANFRDYKIFKKVDMEETLKFIDFTASIMITSIVLPEEDTSTKSIFNIDTIAETIIETMLNKEDYTSYSNKLIKDYKLDCEQQKFLYETLEAIDSLVPKRAIHGYSSLEKLGFKKERVKLIKEINKDADILH